MSFADWARWPARETTILVEMTPAYRLFGGWGAVSADTYSHTFSQLEYGAGIRPVYRKIVAILENGVPLTERATFPDVDDNAGTWIWNGLNTLYVHTTGGGSPDTYTSYLALVRFYFSDRGIVLNLTDGNNDTGVQYAPWLTGGYSKISEAVNDLLSGYTQSVASELTFANGHKWWFPVIATNGPYIWKNKTVRLFIGGSYNGITLLRSEYAAWATMLVEDVAADEDQATFTLKPLKRALDQELPVTPFFAGSYPNLGDGVRGTKKQIGYGRATVHPDLTDTSSNGVYTIADAAYQTLFAVNQVTAVNKSTRAKVTLALTTDYTVNLTACTLTIVNATYKWQDYELWVDVTGKPDGAGSYIKTFSAIVKDLLTTFLEVTTAELDTAAFTQAATDAPQELAVWLKSERSLASIISSNELGFPSLEKSVMGTVEQTIAGLWTCFIWRPGVDPALSLSLRKEDFKKFSPEPKLETVYGSTNCYYGHNAATDEWNIATATDQKTKYETESTDVAQIYTFLVSGSDATVLAQRVQLISGAITLEVEFEERGSILSSSRAGDKVLVTYDPAPDVSGKFDAKPMEIIRVDRSLIPVLSMAGRLGDLRGVGSKVGTWQNSYDRRLLVDNPDGYWRLDTIAGTFVEDRTKNIIRHPGTINGATLGLAGPTVSGHNALSFDGVDDYVEIGDFSAFAYTGGNFTVEGWFQFTDKTQQRILIGKSNFSTGKGWTVFQNQSTNGGIRIYAVNAAGSVICDKFTSLEYNDGLWHHLGISVAAGWAGSGVTFYIDGFPVAMTSNASPGGTADAPAVPLRIGGPSHTTSPSWNWSGGLAEFALYTGVLPEVKINSRATGMRLLAPTWLNANASFRAQSGYWSDSNGFIDPSDPNTRNIRIWW